MVTEVADGAEGHGGPVRVGDEVVAYRINGAYAADVTVPLSSVIPRPSPLSFEEASGMMLTGVTAAHALTVVAVGAGETVLIHGATGGVGLMAVQLAVAGCVDDLALGSSLVPSLGSRPPATLRAARLAAVAPPTNVWIEPGAVTRKS